MRHDWSKDEIEFERMVLDVEGRVLPARVHSKLKTVTSRIHRTQSERTKRRTEGLPLPGRGDDQDSPRPVSSARHHPRICGRARRHALCPPRRNPCRFTQHVP